MTVVILRVSCHLSLCGLKEPNKELGDILHGWGWSSSKKGGVRGITGNVHSRREQSG